MTYSSFKKYIKRFKCVSSNPNLCLVVGITGGGTTLVSSLLDQNFFSDSVVHESQLKFSDDSNFKGKFPRLYKNFEDYRLEMINGYKNSNIKKFKQELLKIYKNHSAYKLKVNTIIDKSPSYHCYRIEYYLKTFKNINIIVIFRDPEENIEGMLRKWPLFKDAGLEVISKFWRDSFENLLSYENEFNPHRTVFIDLNDLKNSSDEIINKIEKIMNLKRRLKFKIYENKLNNKGKALRNVKDGIILIDKKKSLTNFTKHESKLIEDICGDTYKKLKKRKIKL